ncbi:MAG: AarF/UbiB family protein, partial [Candidatus Limiplasma sp.]|nr:AarF/UbiB family protein [Candidatus Limiplasma sp.]
MPVHSETRSENRQRLMEIVEVVRRHELTRGMTPDKLCAMIEDLGPTFIKLGQILSMRSDILPKEYCQALKKLRSDVAPMPYDQVVSIVEESYGRPLDEVFSSFDEKALGSASIA